MWYYMSAKQGSGAWGVVSPLCVSLCCVSRPPFFFYFVLAPQPLHDISFTFFAYTVLCTPVQSESQAQCTANALPRYSRDFI